MNLAAPALVARGEGHARGLWPGESRFCLPCPVAGRVPAHRRCLRESSRKNTTQTNQQIQELDIVGATERPESLSVEGDWGRSFAAIGIGEAATRESLMAAEALGDTAVGSQIGHYLGQYPTNHRPGPG